MGGYKSLSPSWSSLVTSCLRLDRLHSEYGATITENHNSYIPLNLLKYHVTRQRQG